MSKTELIILPSKPVLPVSPSGTSIYPFSLSRNLTSLLLHLLYFNKFCLFYFLYVSKVHVYLYQPKTLRQHSIPLRMKSELFKKADDTLHSLTSAVLSTFKDLTLSLEIEDFPLLRILFLPLFLLANTYSSLKSQRGPTYIRCPQFILLRGTFSSPSQHVYFVDNMYTTRLFI